MMKSLIRAFIGVSAVLATPAADPLYQTKHFALFADHVIESKYSARAVSTTEIESNYPISDNANASSRWKLRTDISRYPQFHSGYLLTDAIYNLSLEELRKDIRPDHTFMAGAKWEGVWTRDISYSILLSLAELEPEIAKASLLRKVRNNRIIQDTGTGGSWPVSSDRMTWALAAWEIYEVTGDRNWLRQSFDIIRASALDDLHVVISASTGLAYGESSFLDWREQTYPRWMNPVDIYNGEALGTNAVFYRTYRILASMARTLGEAPDQWDHMADRIRDAMNERLWIPDRGYYGQYLYGRVYPSLSPRAEALGEALSILFDIAPAANQDAILRSVPVVEYGIPCIYPETPNIPPYHNRAVWPFVQAFWNLATAKRHDEQTLMHGLANIYRDGAFFVTNKENLVADTGSPIGTAINSDRQLWSVAGDLAMVYKILIGMEFTETGIRLHPVIPAALKGSRSLTNFPYRDAVLSFRVDGYGTKIASITLDGKACDPLIPPNLKGEHEVAIRMADDTPPPVPLNLVDSAFAPDTPVANIAGNKLTWNAVEGAISYLVIHDGKPEKKTSELSIEIPSSQNYSEYQVAAVNSSGRQSFASEPVTTGGQQIAIEAETAAKPSSEKLTGYSGTGFIELDRTVNTDLVLPGHVPATGRYAVSFRYSNGSGPVNTNNKCAIRTLLVDGNVVGPIVMPQRGENAWSDWGTSNWQQLRLSSGKHRFELRFDPYDENMDGTVNRAMLDSMILTRIQ